MKAYALVLTHNRQDMVMELVRRLDEDGVFTLVLEHDTTPLPYVGYNVTTRPITTHTGQNFNISALWNIGLDMIESYHQSLNPLVDWTVTVLNDDVLPAEGFVQRMSEAISLHDVDVASPGDLHEVHYIDRTPPKQIPLHRRPAGYAWTVRGRSRIRADETMKIWYSDDDLWQQAKRRRGYILLREKVDHRDANGNFTRNTWWQEQAGRDREVFVKKWGFQPW